MQGGTPTEHPTREGKVFCGMARILTEGYAEGTRLWRYSYCADSGVTDSRLCAVHDLGRVRALGQLHSGLGSVADDAGTVSVG